MRSLIALSLILLAATFANAASNGLSTPITKMKISFECATGKPILSRWYLDMYTSPTSALSFTSETDTDFVVHGNLITLYGPRDSKGHYSYIMDLGHIMGFEACRRTNNGEMAASAWDDVMIEDGLIVSLTHGPQYMCHSIWADDKSHVVTEPTDIAVSVTDLTGATFFIRPGQCQDE